MKLRGRKPKLTFSEQVKLRTIQAAFGENSPEVEQFWDAKRACGAQQELLPQA